jgi:hypothetical protein
MKLSQLLLIVGGFLASYLIYRYLTRKSIAHYVTPSGQWALKWDVPTGTPPFTYMYVIEDETGKTIVDSSTTDTTLILDSTLFVPNKGGLMSDKTYKATVTPTNTEGSGGDDVFSFQIYDTPTIVQLGNNAYDTIIYPTSQGGDIFGTYNEITSNMYLSLSDRVTADNLKVSVTSSNTGKTYVPLQQTPQSVNSAGEAEYWTLSWATCNNNTGKCVPQATFDSGDKLTFDFSATNQAGTFTWSNTYTVGAAPAIVPGNINASSLFLTN